MWAMFAVVGNGFRGLMLSRFGTGEDSLDGLYRQLRRDLEGEVDLHRDAVGDRCEGVVTFFENRCADVPIEFWDDLFDSDNGYLRHGV